MRIDDERDLHQQLEMALEAITPRPAPIDGAVRRGKAIKVRRRLAWVAAGAAAAVAIGVFAVPSLVRHSVAPTGPYSVTVGTPGPHSAPGLIATGTIDGRRWRLAAARPNKGEQVFTASGPGFGGKAASQQGPALAVDSLVPVSFWRLTWGPVQVQYGAVWADVAYVAVRLANGTELTLHPVRVNGLRAVAFAVPVGAGITRATAYSRHGVIAAAVPFNAQNGAASFGVWLKPGQHGLARASGQIGSGTVNGRAWSATAYLGPWGICIEVPATGLMPACVPTTTTSVLDAAYWSLTGGTVSVAGGRAPVLTAWVMVNQPDGARVKVWPVTVGGQKLFAFGLLTGPGRLSWTAYDNSGHVVSSSPG